jgi:peptidoglycan/LPS O-acetylase OafA/YrhL
MTTAPEIPVETRLLTSGNEAGTAPGDRRFRPDVEGLRAVAVVLVVLYHAGLKGLTGGYVGVDVFFVISGFVITGVLLREQAATKGVSIIGFYGRRSRRIIPAATLVIIVTVALTYFFLGVVYGNQTATDARWTAVFLANFHFSSVGTNYLAAQQPPSPLQNFWSLAVEEQFYLVYPTLVLLISAVRTRVSLQARLAVSLTAVIAVSFALSVVQTGSNPTVAYFSPLTRAWELALGALVAVSTRWLLGVPRAIGAAATWLGLGAIVVSAFAYTNMTAYPGSLVAVPVIGTALVIAGGVTAPRWGAESLLKLAPFRWLGKLSYSLYLWHWPILIIAAEAAGKSALPFSQSALWLAVALGASVATYNLIENPVRHANLSKLSRWVPIGLGVVLIATSFGFATVELDTHAAPAVPPTPVTPAGGSNPVTEVTDAVRAAAQIRALPADLTPSLGAPDWGGPPLSCWPSPGQTSIPACVFGDVHGTHTMVVYGDSHAGMWFDAMNYIAAQTHWKLVYLGKGDCPADMLPYENPPATGPAGSEYADCDQWHKFALNRINQLHPDLVVITQDFRTRPDGIAYTSSQWQQGLTDAFEAMRVPASKIIVLGNIPELANSVPQCLVQHSQDVQACSAPPNRFVSRYNRAEMAAASSAGVRYVDVTPWFCSTTCTAVVSKYQVFFDQYHVGLYYSYFLGPVLGQALDLSAYS